MLFAVLTVVTLAGAAFQRTYTRYRAQTDPATWTTETVADRCVWGIIET